MMWCSVIRLKNSYSNLFPWKFLLIFKCISIAHKQKLQLSIILLILPKKHSRLTWLQITFRYMDMEMILAFCDPCCINVSRDKCFVHSLTHKFLYHWTLLTKWKFLPPLSIDEVCGNWVFYLSSSTVFNLSSSSSSCFLLSSIAPLSFLTSHAVIGKRSQYIDHDKNNILSCHSKHGKEMSYFLASFTYSPLDIYVEWESIICNPNKNFFFMKD